ncbi:HAD family hydrolase [Gloeobacter kilaueensis]|uniref:Phosphoglycolate phosphatase n=1 Tax=Gloeobacter kilaueensis (strain ATCC BAA-2537 / CCAP 1431/1 / ULC 316 / JS1) TaxID=1183438 RepID=U5QNX9_GLOK1|nr:hypothetical protein [Gloeobacter kilaueensis]AGY60646.1 phosphoglycolate phosphatase [Gloeobacter kilaueensis JS1]
MATPGPDLLALDFDGVICDGLKEYFQTSWLAYCKLWPDTDPVAPAGVAERFYQLRPVIETGWEMPLLLRAILEKIESERIFAEWPTLSHQLLAISGFSTQQLTTTVDGMRDEWIERDLPGWLAVHRFYPGVIESLRRWEGDAQLRAVIITTKASRFVLELLGQAGLVWPAADLFGKDIRQPKSHTLAQLLAAGYRRIWFVEDRFATLRGVQQLPDLQTVGLFLAAWGYNTASERQQAENDSRIRLLPLRAFGSADFGEWQAVD